MPSSSKKQAAFVAAICAGRIKKKSFSRKQACEWAAHDRKKGRRRKK